MILGRYLVVEYLDPSGKNALQALLPKHAELTQVTCSSHGPLSVTWMETSRVSARQGTT